MKEPSIESQREAIHIMLPICFLLLISLMIIWKGCGK